ncbi:hypothetical protein KKH43_01625 [Patescibacteria group bacterium]|nr:hypothetical protein [Patescibacteria group bacterium]
MQIKTLSTKAVCGVLVGFLVLTFSGCTIPLYHQVVEANKKVDEVKKIFSDSDAVVSEAHALSQKVYNDSLTQRVMENNLDDINELNGKLDTEKENLVKAEGILKEVEGYRLPQDYKDGYLKAVKDGRSKRIEQIDVVEGLLFESENLASALVDYYSAINRLEQVGNRMGEMPEISFENPETIEQAKQILGEVSTGAKEVQAEFNDAAASVSVDVFTKLRDTAVDLGNVADASDALVTIYEALLTAAINGDEQGFVNAYNQLPVQLEVLVASLEKFEAGFPADLVDNNGDLTTKAENMIQTWKDDNFKDLFNQYDDLQKTIDDIDNAISQGYK